MFTNEFVRKIVQHLGEACGFTLSLVEGSLSGEGAFASATARSCEPAENGSQVRMNVRAQLLFTSNDDGGTDSWALVFFYVNGVRVAPTGLNHLKFKLEVLDSGVLRWVVRGWEADVYEEWTESEHLQDDD